MQLENGFVLSLPRDLVLDDDTLMALSEANPELRFERDENRQLIIMSPTGSQAGRYHSMVLAELYMWNKFKETGAVFDSSAGFKLPDGSVRAADVAWVSIERWKAVRDEEKEKFAPVCPDFVVEIKSPSDSWEQLKHKMDQWVINGTQLGWLLDVSAEKAVVYTQHGTEEIMEYQDRTLEGRNVLPGFSFDLSQLTSLQ